MAESRGLVQQLKVYAGGVTFTVRDGDSLAQLSPTP